MLSLRELDPALRTRTRNALVGPNPGGEIGRVMAVVARVLPAAQPPVDHLLPDMSRRGTERRHAVDHIDDEVVAIEVVEHDHVEGRGRRAFLLVSADGDGGVIGAPVRGWMSERGVAVVRDYEGHDVLV